jgi:cell division protein ZapE|tara:strand:- start:1554 stop:2591 length:1038 start_codon:yes stop_codon:yes gene_type:complete
MVSNQQLTFDEKQFFLIEKLDLINDQILKQSHNWFRKKKIKGLYIKGEVGRGKTQIMDIFFENLKIERKQRLHFHRFMKKLHEELDRLSGKADPLEKIAEELAESTEVLCFDEFFVEDIGDAMLLGRFIRKLFKHPVTLIATSNTLPDDLYKDGLHRDRFYPAIESIKENCEVFELASIQDYRLRTLEKLEIYLITKEDPQDKLLAKNFSELTNSIYEKDRNVEILGRKIKTKRLANGSVWFSFNELCEGPRSSKDYIDLCTEFHTIFISDIPIFRSENNDSARRFIALIDECYERNVNLILSSEVNIKEIYFEGHLRESFKRTSSRLEEMRSREYLSKPHLAIY